ncbi:hypothetical protein BOX15_Mlig007481g1, partial [Macrostomum lignano]
QSVAAKAPAAAAKPWDWTVTDLDAHRATQAELHDRHERAAPRNFGAVRIKAPQLQQQQKKRQHRSEETDRQKFDETELSPVCAAVNDSAQLAELLERTETALATCGSVFGDGIGKNLRQPTTEGKQQPVMMLPARAEVTANPRQPASNPTSYAARTRTCDASVQTNNHNNLCRDDDESSVSQAELLRRLKSVESDHRRLSAELASSRRTASE